LLPIRGIDRDGDGLYVDGGLESIAISLGHLDERGHEEHRVERLAGLVDRDVRVALEGRDAVGENIL